MYRKYLIIILHSPSNSICYSIYSTFVVIQMQNSCTLNREDEPSSIIYISLRPKTWPRRVYIHINIYICICICKIYIYIYQSRLRSCFVRVDALYACFLYCIPDKRCREREEERTKARKTLVKSARHTRANRWKERKKKRAESERLRLIKARTRHSSSIRDWLLLVRWLSLPRLLTSDA